MSAGPVDGVTPPAGSVDGVVVSSEDGQIGSDGAPVPVAMAQMFGARIASTVVATVAVAVLGRLLTPSDFGVFGVGLAVLGVAQAVSEFGLSHFLVRRDALSDDDVRSAAGLAIVLSTGIFVSAVTIVLLLGSVAGVDLPGGTLGVAVLLGASLVADAVAMPYEALRQRDVRFRLIAAIAVAQAVVDAGVAIGLASAGVGPTALAAGLFGSRLASALVLVRSSPGGSRVRPSRSGWRRFGRFGGGFAAARLMPRVGELAVVSTISRGLGVGPVGLYNRAGTVYSIPDRTIFEAINPVVFPALAKALRSSVSAARVYLDKLDYLSAVCWPAFASIAVLADPLVSVMLGSQWGGAVDPVRILAVAGLFAPFTKMSMKLFVAMNRIDVHLRVQGAYVAATVVGAAIGGFFSLEAVCAALVVAQVVQTVGVWTGVSRSGSERLSVPWASVRRSLLLTVVTLVGPVAVVVWGGLGDLVSLVVATVIGGACWLVTMRLIEHPLLTDALAAVGRRPRAATG